MGRFFRKKLLQSERRPYCSAVIVAAGSSVRMEGTDKILAYLGDLPVLVHTMMGFEACPDVDELVLVTRPEILVEVGRLCKMYGISKASKVILGGETRVHSVQNGLLEVNPQADLIAIHDGARPFASPQMISAVVKKAASCGAAAPAVGVYDTVKEVQDGLVTRTVPRRALAAVQTPQVFDSALIKGAIHKALEEQWEITDDCSAVEALGMSVHLVEGLEYNMKITAPAHLAMAEGILAYLREEAYV